MSGASQFEQLDHLGLYHLLLDEARGRNIRSNGRALIDFVSTNYLGFDHSASLASAGERATRDWGSLAGWSRMELDPLPYRMLEERIATFLGAQAVMLSHTITLTNFSLIPGIVGTGHIIADALVHKVVWEACRLARDHGARLSKFRHQDMTDLESQLRELPLADTKLIAVDGVYSISGEIAPILELQALCERYNAWLYVDDAHGFGILGSHPTAENPYGAGGQGVVRYANGDYDRTFYVASFAKAFGVQAAFATIPRLFAANARAFCLQYLFSAPFSPYTVGQVEGALDLNASTGEAARLRLRALTTRLIEGLRRMNVAYQNILTQPIVYVRSGTFETLIRAAGQLLLQGCVAGFRVYPLVAKDDCGFRFALTALHEEAHIDRAIEALSGLRNAALLTEARP